MKKDRYQRTEAYTKEVNGCLVIICNEFDKVAADKGLGTGKWTAFQEQISFYMLTKGFRLSDKLRKKQSD